MRGEDHVRGELSQQLVASRGRRRQEVEQDLGVRVVSECGAALDGLIGRGRQDGGRPRPVLEGHAELGRGVVGGLEVGEHRSAPRGGDGLGDAGHAVSLDQRGADLDPVGVGGHRGGDPCRRTQFDAVKRYL